MQHTRNCVSKRSVAGEAKTTDLYTQTQKALMWELPVYKTMRVSASSHMTGLRWSGCYGIAPAHQ
jgi:hypothetical protein